MSGYIRQYCSVSRNEVMDSQGILELVDKEKMRRWLQSVCGPTLVTPGFFEQMGFPAWFVRQYLKKQRKVLLRDGTVQHRVRGVFEMDFLWGFAEAAGADTARARQMSPGYMRTTSSAEACLKALDEADGNE